MADFKIECRDWEVRALLREIEAPGSGKTQTRRLAWREPPSCCGDILPGGGCCGEWVAGKPTIWQSVKPGDRLWVRESFYETDKVARIGVAGRPPTPAVYRADISEDEWRFAKWTPSIHMPRWASRITLLVEATKMEPLLSISEEDAQSEGFSDGRLDDGFGPRPFGDTGMTVESPGTLVSAAGAFQMAWAKLHPDWDGWSSPEVVALTFRPVLANIDQVAEAA